MGKVLLAGAISGIVSAASVDIHAFRSSPNPIGSIKTFNWKLALTRWALGGVTGALGAAGLVQVQ